MSQTQRQFSKSLLQQWQLASRGTASFSFYRSSEPTSLCRNASAFAQQQQIPLKFIRLFPNSTYAPFDAVFSLLRHALSESLFDVNEIAYQVTDYKPLQKQLIAILTGTSYQRHEITVADDIYFEKKAFINAIAKLIETLITTPTLIVLSGWHFASTSDIKLLQALATRHLNAPLLLLISIDTQHTLTHRQDDEEWENFLDWLDDTWTLHKVPECKSLPVIDWQLESRHTLNIQLIKQNLKLMAWTEVISLSRVLLDDSSISEKEKIALRLKLAEALIYDNQLDAALDQLEIVQIYQTQLSSFNEQILLLNLLSVTQTLRQSFEDAIQYAESAYKMVQHGNHEQWLMQSLFVKFFAYDKSSSPLPLQDFEKLDLGLQKFKMDCSRLYVLRNYYTYLRYYDELDSQSALYVTQLSIKLAKHLGHTQGIAASYHSRAIIYSYIGNNHCALRCFTISANLRKKLGNKNESLKIHNGLGYFSNLREQYENAQKEYLCAYKIACEMENDSELVVTLFNLSWLYFTTNDYQRSVNILEQLVRICRIRQITHFPFRNLYDVFGLKGYCHAKLDQLASAHQCLERIQDLPFQPSRTGEFLQTLLQGSLHRGNRNLKKARETFEKAPLILGNIVDMDTCLLPKCSIELLEVYSRQGDWESCQTLVDNSLIMSEALSLPRYKNIFNVIKQQVISQHPIYAQNIAVYPLPKTTLQLNQVVRNAKLLTQLRQAQQHLREMQLINRMQSLHKRFTCAKKLAKESLKLMCGNFNIQLGMLHHFDGQDWNLWHQFGEENNDVDVEHCLKKINGTKKPCLETSFYSLGEDGKRATYDFIACLPIFVDEHLYAAITLRNINSNRYLSNQDQNIIAMICRELGTQLQQIEHRENLLKISQTDPLSGLFNRKALLTRLQQELLLYAQHGGSHQCSLAYIDLDNFKIVNDLLGHDMGDRVINQFAELLRQLMRSIDTVARWGGDEFVIVFPNVNQSQAYIIAQRILTALEEQQFFKPLLCEWSGKPEVVATLPPLSCSIGITDCSGVSYEELNEDWLLKQADAALYKAKAEGKARVSVRSK